MSTPKEILFELWTLLLIALSAIWENISRLIVPSEGKSLRNEVAVVTGAGHGIGRQLALQLAREGVKVVCWDINGKTVEETAQEIRRRHGIAYAFQCDVGNEEEVKKVAQETRETLGTITMLFNNAGIMPCKPFLKHSSKDINQVFEVNVKSQFWTLFEFLPGFIEQKKGHIVSMSSTAGVTGTPHLTAYCATKYAVRGLMDALLLEMRDLMKPEEANQLNMTVIHPFVVNTGLAQKPKTRFDSLIPITEPAQAASIIIKAVKMNDYEVYVPQRLFYLFAMSHLMPLKLKLALFDFLGCGVGAHED